MRRLPSVPRSLNVNVATGSRSVGYHSAVRGSTKVLHPSNEPAPQLPWGSILSTKGGTGPMQFRGQPQPNALAPLQITLTAAVIAACWGGCGAAMVTQPLPVGPNTYAVSARTPHGGAVSAREAALSAANQQCARLSKRLLVLKTSSNIELDEKNETAKDKDVIEVTFRCLAAGDPELHRPNSQPH